MRLRKIVAPQRINKIFSHGPTLIRSTGRSLNPNLCDEKWQLTNSSRSCLPSFLCCCQLFPFCLGVIKISKRRLFISFLSFVAFVGTVCVCVCVCGGSNLLHLSCANVAQRLTAAQFAVDPRGSRQATLLIICRALWQFECLSSLPSFLPFCLPLPSLSAAFFFRHY